MINTPPHISRNPTGIGENEQFWHEEHQKIVREYDRVPGHEEPHKLGRSRKTLQGCVRTKSWER